MSSEIHPVILRYLELVESGEPRVCPEQTALAAYVRRVFATEDLTVDGDQLNHYLSMARYFPFQELFPWEAFLLALWDCTYTAEGLPRWKTVLVMVGRGAGKDGLIAFDSFYQEKKLNRHYYHTKELVQGRKNKGVIRGRTNNPKGRDGMRSGKVIFNEVHAFENYANIKVFVTGQGKVAQPRVGIFTSNGEVNDGPLDDYLARGRRILFENEPDRGFLPFICCLESKDQVHDEANWYMANPSLAYLPNLLQETRDEYHDWVEHPEQNGDFLTKRMGLRAGFQEISVTDYEKVKATNRELPDLRGWSCTVGLDYAELSDWASVNLHFRRGSDRFDINHSWICAQSKTLPRVKAPWQIRMLAMDHYRWTLVSEAMRRIGWDANDKTRVKLVRPSDIMQVEPVIQECFDREYFTWGDCPPLRWAVNNTKRVRSSKKLGVDTGNYIYAKIEGKSRKTDPWMALVASMTAEPVLGAGEAPQLPLIGAIKLY